MRKCFALIWLFIIILLLAYNIDLIKNKRMTFNTNILSLLPADQQDPVIQTATDHMFNAVSQQVAVLIGAPNWADASRAADAYLAVIKTHPDLIQTTQYSNADLTAFDKYRLGLLTLNQEELLKNQPASYWTNIALGSLYSPVIGLKLGTWQDDPFGLFSGWLQARAQETPVRPRDGKLFVAGKKNNYAVILMTLQKPAFSMSTQKTVMPLLNQAEQAAQSSDPNIKIISTGVILHAAAASNEAHKEMSTIAVGSLLGILLLMWLAFRSFKPLLLIGLSISVGCLGAFSICEYLLGELHVLTLVFGASLIGIAQDYAIYYLCSAHQELKKLWPGLILTLTAALVGYTGLALTPFPGLQQMALFSGLGLIFAWLTVILWFPIFVTPNTIKVTNLAKKFDNSLSRWPLFRFNKKGLLIILLFFIFISVGLFKLTVSDDIRSLQNPSPHLVHDQIKFSQLLNAPTLVQFYLVRGDSEQMVLQREEALKLQLKTGYQAISDWVPSIQRQETNQLLIKQKLLFNHGPLDSLAQHIGENSTWSQKVKNNLLKSSTLLTPELFFNMPASQPLKFLWLGKINNTYASIVAVRGLNHVTHTDVTLQGVQWVDKISAISSVLGHYRKYMGHVILGAYGAILILLFTRYRFKAWRVLMPPALASLSTLAIFGFLGIPLELFHVLALMLILGLGVDYGIFLQEQSRLPNNQAWLTIGLSAISALLSFGLLGLSQTPPLHAFGLTMFLGLILVGLIAPIFRNTNGY
ncbi:MAG TPA: MMPL family transporter [Gammaproteobacteria bacterium]|nr:MMPL family transporter [Gammaproteobacteria bacterium]